MSKKPLSKMDHTKKALDMDYLKQPRGPGTGWVFYMVTPPELIGKPNPLTGKLCRKTLIMGLGTRHPVEARKRRDIALGEIRKAVAELSDEGRFSLSSAEEWREMIANDDSEEQGIELVLSDQLEKAAERGVPEAQLKSFNRVALGKGYPITKALEQYIDERSPGNRRNFKPLALTTVGNLRTAVGHLRSFLEDHQNIACMEDVTPNSARGHGATYLGKLALLAESADAARPGELTSHATYLAELNRRTTGNLVSGRVSVKDEQSRRAQVDALALFG
ncbi:hypothetical protein [Antarctobacter sp.]|uniref:hypothetical protein n=1 Tax=Antarctobacter sp. TaxID=1872577 RepID=UPI002B27694B|nr:hypothetical protein [Antarctobacter sp.]